MSTRRIVRLVVLALVVALGITAPASAGRGVIPFKAVMTGLTLLDPGVATPLPGGRVQVTGMRLAACYAPTEVDPQYDYISGCFECTCDEIIQPSGAIRVTNGKCWSTDLAIFAGPDTGGWVGEMSGEWAPPNEAGLPRLISLHNTSVGWGDLEGWTMEWRERALNYFDEVDFGHFKPPK